MKIKCHLVITLITLSCAFAQSEGSADLPAIQNELSTPTPVAAAPTNASNEQPGEPPQPLSLANNIQSVKGLLRRASESVRSNDFEELEEILKDTTLIPILKKGGPIMIPLLITSILAMGTVIDRLFFLLNEGRKRDRKALARFLVEVNKRDFVAARMIGKKSKFNVVRVLNYGLEHQGRSLTSALLFAQEQEMKRFRRGIPMLDTVITLAPLLGLLGTVTGMMGSFSLIGGELGAPGAITGGIAEALIATAFGLGIAITSLIPFNYLNNKMEEARLEIETASSQLLVLMAAKEKPAARRKAPPTREPLNGEKYAQTV